MKRASDFNAVENNTLFELRDVHDVPFSFREKVRKEWWKFTIPQFFTAYKPDEIEEWDEDKILEHLAAISEIKHSEKGGGK